MARVKNVQGKHYEIPYGFDSWLDYWETYKGEEAGKCSKYFCQKDAVEGGHVVRVPDDGSIYLVPICYTHNHYTFTSEYYVPDSALLKVPEEDLVEVDD